MAFCVRQTLHTVRSIRVTSVLCNRNFRMSAKLRAEQALEEMNKKNPYFEKYAAKLAALTKQSPEEFLNRLDSVDKTADGLDETLNSVNKLLNSVDKAPNSEEANEKPRFVISINSYKPNQPVEILMPLFLFFFFIL